MTLKSKLITVPTVLALAVVAIVGFQATKIKKPGDSNFMILSVTFLPTRRTEVVKIIWSASDGRKGGDTPTISPWAKSLVVKRGTMVTVAALHTSGDRLTCTITRNEILADSKSTVLPGQVACTAWA